MTDLGYADEVMDANTFFSFVEDGYYNDFDGTGYYVVDGKVGPRVNLKEQDDKYKEVAWFNR